MKVQKFKLSVDEIAEATGEGRPTIYAAIRAGDLRTFLVGRRRFSRPDAVKAWIDYLQAQSDAGHPVGYLARRGAA